MIKSIRIYRRVSLQNRLSWIGFGLFTAVLVYMFVGIVNDSNVCTAPVFWCMLGLGLAVNRMLVEKDGLFVKETAEAEVENAIISEDKTDKQVKQTTPAATNVKKSSAKKQSRKQRKNQKK